MKTKLLILLGFMSIMTTAYAKCQHTIIVNTDGSKVLCYICQDGKYIQCYPMT